MQFTNFLKAQVRLHNWLWATRPKKKNSETKSQSQKSKQENKANSTEHSNFKCFRSADGFLHDTIGFATKARTCDGRWINVHSDRNLVSVQHENNEHTIAFELCLSRMDVRSRCELVAPMLTKQLTFFFVATKIRFLTSSSESLATKRNRSGNRKTIC